METLPFFESLLVAIVSALTIGMMLMPLIRRYTLRVFDEDVLNALRREQERYRAFHEEVFKYEIERGRETARVLSEVQASLTRHAEDFKAFRIEAAGQHDLLITIPQTVVHLDETIKQLRATLERFDNRLENVQNDVSQLKVRAGR